MPDGVCARYLFVCADAPPNVGIGHVMRSLAVADELARRGFRSRFLVVSLPGDLRDTVQQRGHEVQVAGGLTDAPVRVLGTRRADWALVDSPALDETWERRARRVANRIAAFDDLADRRHAADLVIDPNVGALSDKYTSLVPEGAEILAGPRYAPLRPEILQLRPTRGSVAERVARLVISLGGSDLAGVTASALRAARSALPDVAIDVIVGASFSGTLGAIDEKTTVHGAATDVAPILASSDLVIGAGGTCALERACLGLPSLVVQMAANQVAVSDALASHGVAENLGWFRELDDTVLASAIRALAADRERRQAMVDAGMRLVDGLGIQRVANHIDGVRLRPARWADRRLLFDWANDPVTRGNSINTAPIQMPDHLGWLRRALEDASIDLLIASTGLGPVGVVSLAPGSGGHREVSITVAPEHRGTVGGLVLRAAVHRWVRQSPREVLVARIRPGNVASERAFIAAGFLRGGPAGDTVLFTRPPGGVDGPG